MNNVPPGSVYPHVSRSRSSHTEAAPAPLGTALLAAGVIGGYALELAGGGMPVCERLGFVPAHPSLGTAITSLFVHDPTALSHVLGNLAFLVVFGVIVERALGSLGFLALYALAGLGGAALHLVVDPSSTVPLVGCSGALFGVMAVAGVLRPRLLGFVVVYVGINIWRAMEMDGSGVSFGCHLGGFFVGALVAVALRAAGSKALELA